MKFIQILFISLTVINIALASENSTTTSTVSAIETHNLIRNQTNLLMMMINSFNNNSSLPYCSNLPCNLRYCFYFKTRIDGFECIKCGCE